MLQLANQVGETRVRLRRALVLSAAAGVGVPAACLALMQLTRSDLTAGVAAQRFVLMVWPSSIFLLASQEPGPSAVDPLLLIAVAANVVLYSALGALLWAGLTRRRVYLVPLLVFLPLLWWRLWTL